MSTRTISLTDDEYLLFLEQTYTAAELVAALHIDISDLLSNAEYLLEKVFEPKFYNAQLKLMQELSRR